MSEQGQPERLTATDEPSGQEAEKALQQPPAQQAAQTAQQAAPEEQLTDAEESRDVGEPGGDGITADLTTPVLPETEPVREETAPSEGA